MRHDDLASTAVSEGLAGGDGIGERWRSLELVEQSPYPCGRVDRTIF